jgi:hypothetical protein
MTLRFEPVATDPVLAERTVFLSASIPDPERWTGGFDPREISDAVVAAARAVLTAGGTLVTAAHPTIAPLLLYVAAEFPRDDAPPRVITYQSSLFEHVMPDDTRRFQDSGIGDFRFTQAEPGDTAVPSGWARSLLSMREVMFGETRPVAAIFVGGMAGIREEYDLLVSRQPRPLVYPIGRPGGEAERLAWEVESDLRALLIAGDVYPSVFRAVIADIARRLA